MLSSDPFVTSLAQALGLPLGRLRSFSLRCEAGQAVQVEACMYADAPPVGDDYAMELRRFAFVTVPAEALAAAAQGPDDAEPEPDQPHRPSGADWMRADADAAGQVNPNAVHFGPAPAPHGPPMPDHLPFKPLRPYLLLRDGRRPAGYVEVPTGYPVWLPVEHAKASGRYVWRLFRLDRLHLSALQAGEVLTLEVPFTREPHSVQVVHVEWRHLPHGLQAQFALFAGAPGGAAAPPGARACGASPLAAAPDLPPASVAAGVEAPDSGPVAGPAAAAPDLMAEVRRMSGGV